MEDLTRLIISHERIENIKNNNLELSKEEAHYLNKVMRVKENDAFSLFNKDGEWQAKILGITKGIVNFKITKQERSCSGSYYC